MDQKFKKIDGVQDTLEVFADKVTITPKGFLGFGNKGLKGTKTIPFRSVTAIQFKKAGFMSGYIQFSIQGGLESRGGIMAAVKDENSFIFRSSRNDEMEKIRQLIEERLAASRQVNTAKTFSMADELTKLVNLKSSGAISESEFDELKSQLLKKSS